MKAVLVLQKCWDVIGGPESDVVDASADKKAKAWLTLNVQDEHVEAVESAGSAREAWAALEKTFKGKSTARKLEASRLLSVLEMEPTEEITEYVGRAKALRTDLLSAGCEVSEEQVVYQVLIGLPSEYDIAVRLLEDKQDLKLDDVLAKLLREEARLKRDAGQAQGGYGRMNIERAMTAVPRRSALQSGFGFGFSRGRTCWHCNEPGHFRHECPKLKANAAREATQAGGRSGDRRGDRSGGRGCSFGGGVMHTYAMAATGGTWDTVFWILDSGAGHHITGNRDLLTDVRPCPDISVKFGNGGVLQAVSMGTVIIHTQSTLGVVESQILLQDVLYVPGAAANLLSVGRAIDKGAQITFTKQAGIIRHGGDVIAYAPASADGTYRLRIENPAAVPAMCAQPAEVCAMYVAMGSVPEQDQLRLRRCGHSGYGGFVGAAAQDCGQSFPPFPTPVPAATSDVISHAIDALDEGFDVSSHAIDVNAEEPAFGEPATDVDPIMTEEAMKSDEANKWLQVACVFVSAAHMIADVLTKVLCVAKHAIGRAGIGVSHAA